MNCGIHGMSVLNTVPACDGAHAPTAPPAAAPVAPAASAPEFSVAISAGVYPAESREAYSAPPIAAGENVAPPAPAALPPANVPSTAPKPASAPVAAAPAPSSEGAAT